MIDYSLWEVILNGDSPILTRVIDGVVQPVAPTTSEQRLARKNELKACGTLLILPDKHQLKINIHKDAKTLMEEIEKRFGGDKETKKVQKSILKQQYENFTSLSSESLDQIHDRMQKLISQLKSLGESLSQKDINLKFLRSLPIEWRAHTLIWRNKTDLEDQSLDDLFNILKIYEAEVKSSSSASTSTQNITFVSSQNTNNTNESVSAVASVSAASAKVSVSALPNVDTLSDAVIYSFSTSQSNSPQLDNDDLKQIDADDLKEMDLKWQMAMLTMRVKRFLQKTGRDLGTNGTTSIRFNMSKVECYNCHKRGHFARECRSPKDTRRNVPVEPQRRNLPVETSMSSALVSQCDGVGSYDWSFQAEKEPTNYALMAFTSSSSSSSDNELRDNALVDLWNKFKKAEQERDELKLKLEKFQTSSKNLSQLLASQTNDKTGFGYDNQVFTSFIFDCDEQFSFESDVSMPGSPVNDRYQSGEGYHVVPPPYTGTFMPLKPDLVFHDALTVNETVHTVFNVELSPTKPDKDLSHRPSTPIIEDWVSDSEDESEAEPSQNDPSFVQPTKQVKTLRPFVKPAEHPIPANNLRTDSPKNHAQKGNHQDYARMTHPNPHRHEVPTAVLTRSKLVPLTAARPVTIDVPHNNVIRPTPAKTVGTKPHSPPRRHTNRRPSPKPITFPQKVTTAKVPQVNAVKGV
nr:hypothetical protein [Tanacetum cinerariifolium]